MDIIGFVFIFLIVLAITVKIFLLANQHRFGEDKRADAKTSANTGDDKSFTIGELRPIFLAYLRDKCQGTQDPDAKVRFIHSANHFSKIFDRLAQAATAEPTVINMDDNRQTQVKRSGQQTALYLAVDNLDSIDKHDGQ